MNCERFDRLIHLFLDGRLDQDQEKELQEHLSKCERCAGRLALFEKIEGRARRIPAKEPSQEYWNTFSSRVREKIAARKETSPVFGLKKALERMFAYSPLKIKVAAGLVSIALVFLIGKLYIDYKGQRILPGEVAVQPQKRPRLEITEMEREEGFPVPETRRKKQPLYKEPRVRKEGAAKVRLEERALPLETAKVEKDVSSKKGEPPADRGIAEQEPPPSAVPALPEAVKEEAEALAKRQREAPETKTTGAGVEEKAEFEEPRDVLTSEREADKAVGIPQPAEAKKPESKQFILPDLTASLRKAVPAERYVAREMTIPRIEEDDTLMRAEGLTQAIQVWKAYIQKNPDDSLTKEGYLQVATAYYLLAKLTGDTTKISEGSSTIREYIEQVKDKETKDRLNDRATKIEALRQR